MELWSFFFNTLEFGVSFSILSLFWGNFGFFTAPITLALFRTLLEKLY